MYGPPTPPTHHRAVPDCAYLHAERREPGVTLELLHLEAEDLTPEAVPFLRFEAAAQELFDGWRAALEHRLRAEEDHPLAPAVARLTANTL